MIWKEKQSPGKELLVSVEWQSLENSKNPFPLPELEPQFWGNTASSLVTILFGLQKDFLSSSNIA
jgi:hypothetical protein